MEFCFNMNRIRVQVNHLKYVIPQLCHEEEQYVPETFRLCKRRPTALLIL